MRTALGLTAVTAMVTLMIAGVSGSNRFSGPVVVQLFRTHGIRRGDLLVVLIGMVGILAITVLWRRR